MLLAEQRRHGGLLRRVRQNPLPAVGQTAASGRLLRPGAGPQLRGDVRVRDHRLSGPRRRLVPGRRQGPTEGLDALRDREARLSGQRLPPVRRPHHDPPHPQRHVAGLRQLHLLRHQQIRLQQHVH